MTPGWDSIVCTLDGRFDDAIALCEQAIERGAEVHREVLSLLQAMFDMCLPLTYLGQAERYLEVVRAYMSAAAPPRAEAHLLLALTLTQLGRIHEARAAAESYAQTSMEHSTVHSLLRLELANAWRDVPAAGALARQLTPVAHLVLFDGAMPSVARLLGSAALLCSDVAAARRHFESAIEHCRQVGFRPELALSRLDLAELLLDHFPGEASRALEQLRMAAAEFETMRMVPALERAEQRLALLGDVAPPHQPKVVPGGLTLRECEVAALLGVGASNREIAESLVISQGTVGVHVKHILSKLDLKSRAQVAVWAAQQGLVERAERNGT